MAPVSRTRWLRSLVRTSGTTYYKKKSPGSTRPLLEALEDRTMLSVLPTPLVSNQATIKVPTSNGAQPLTGFSPAMVQDPVNPLKLVEVHSTGVMLSGSFSKDG